MQQSKLFLFLFLAVFFLSCVKNEFSYETWSSYDEYGYECEYVERTNSIDQYLTEEEREAIESCSANKINSKAEIEANLIGEWELIGHAFNSNDELIDDQPCCYLWFEENQVIVHLQDNSTNIITTLQWEINPNNLELILDESFSPLEGIQIICPQYLTKDNNCDDCFIPIFERRS